MDKKEFKERVLGLFNKYKDKPMGSIEEFNNEIYLKYGFVPSSKLRKSLIDYQIKKYGAALDDKASKDKLYIKGFYRRTKKCRDTAADTAKRRYQSNKDLKRLEEQKETALKLEAQTHKNIKRKKIRGKYE